MSAADNEDPRFQEHMKWLGHVSDNWPPYHIGSRDHLHAIGVAIAAWNMIETAYQFLIQIVFPSNIAAGIHAFELLNNDARVKLIRVQLLGIVNEQELDLLDHFLKCANLCKEYRNVLTHSGYSNQPPGETILMARGISRDRSSLNLVRLSVASVREIADATYATAAFGLDLGGAITMRLSNESWAVRGIPPRFSPALPEKPPLPRSWDQIREAPTPDPPPPRSSRG